MSLFLCQCRVFLVDKHAQKCPRPTAFLPLVSKQFLHSEFVDCAWIIHYCAVLELYAGTKAYVSPYESHECLVCAYITGGIGVHEYYFHKQAKSETFCLPIMQYNNIARVRVSDTAPG